MATRGRVSNLGGAALVGLLACRAPKSPGGETEGTSQAMDTGSSSGTIEQTTQPTSGDSGGETR